MPEKRTTQRARRDRRQGKKASTQAGHYVAEEMRHKKSGKHPVKNRKQAIAIGLSKARRSGVKVPKRGKTAKKTGTSGYSKRKGSSSSKRSSGSSRSRRSTAGRKGSSRKSSRPSRSRSRR